MEHAVAGFAWPRLRARGLVEFAMVGGLTLFLYPLSWLVRQVVPLDEAELAVGFTAFWGAHVINDPHFSVTYLLFYEDGKARAFGDAFPRALRWRWWLSGVVVPFALAAFGILAVLTESNEALGAMVQLMFLLVGWHYGKQGFGVMSVLCARRGVRFAPLERRILLAHVYVGWLFSWANPHDPGGLRVQKGVFYDTLAHPAWLETVLFVALIASALALVVMLVRKTSREGAAVLGTPLVAFLVSLWAWLVFSGIDPLVRYVTPAMHAIQYLWFVRLLKANESRERERALLGSAKTRLRMLAVGALVLGFLLFDVLPDTLDAFAVPEGGWENRALGATPWLAMTYVFVNVHHYAMDAVIWRRENPATRHLVVDVPEPRLDEL
ncbi:MAG: hypothetical protein R3B99_00675 [Polyangiales bacterium]